MGKPIEPGSLCMIYRVVGKYAWMNGLVGTVERYVHKGDTFQHDHTSAILIHPRHDGWLMYHCAMNCGFGVIREKNLMRLDDDDDLTLTCGDLAPYATVDRKRTKC